MKELVDMISGVQTKSKSTAANIAEALGVPDLSDQFSEEASKFKVEKMNIVKNGFTMGRNFDKGFLKKWKYDEMFFLTVESATIMAQEKAESVWYNTSHMVLSIKMESGKVYGIRSIDVGEYTPAIVKLLSI